MGKQVQLRFDTNENGCFIEKQIAEKFPEYELTENLMNGGEEILLSITRIQSPNSGDDWGRTWNEDTLVSEKYLVKKREHSSGLPCVPEPKFYVFFGDEMHEYEVHLGVYDKGTPEEAFVVLDGPFGLDQRPNPISDGFKEKADAIWKGIQYREPKIEAEFTAYRDQLHRKKRSQKKNR
jgi:hypothetical protein